MQKYTKGKWHWSCYKFVSNFKLHQPTRLETITYTNHSLDISETKRAYNYCFKKQHQQQQHGLLIWLVTTGYYLKVSMSWIILLSNSPDSDVHVLKYMSQVGEVMFHSLTQVSRAPSIIKNIHSLQMVVNHSQPVYVGCVVREQRLYVL